MRSNLRSRREARGSFNPETFTVTLLKGADLSTALHERAHFFFENDLALAAESVTESRAVGLASLKPGERQILADVSVPRTRRDELAVCGARLRRAGPGTD